MTRLKELFLRYFDYDIVGSYLAYDRGRFIVKYVKRYKLRRRNKEP